MLNSTFRNDLENAIEAFPAIFPRYLLAAFTIITTLAVFVPLNPGMPSSGLDPSWVFSMNEAVAQNLNIGQDVIFTYGPYASIFTRSYHPATDHLMVFGSIFFGLCYAIALLYLVNDKKPLHVLGFLLFMTWFAGYTDPLLCSYPLLLGSCAFKFSKQVDQYEEASYGYWQIITIAFLFAPLGLLPLVKGSFLLGCAVTAAIIFFWYLYRSDWKLAWLVVISPIVSTCVFWVISGQSLFALPDYFVNMSQIISGYSEAMAWPGNFREIVVYLIAAMIVLLALVKSDEASVSSVVFLSSYFALFLFLAFKKGFVRHYENPVNAGISLVTAGYIGSLIHINKRVLVALFISIIVCLYIYKSYTKTSTGQLLEQIPNTYANAWYGLRSRMIKDNKLRHRFEHSLVSLRKEYPISALQGTTDIYSYNQAYLLASSNKWNPRPIIQSYSAYTSKLVRFNEQHLRGSRAPDNVLFRVEPIDGRLPSLEDGLSWPALLDNYAVTKLDNYFAYLRKREGIKATSALDLIQEGRHNMGEEVVLPVTKTPIFAELDLKPTLFGRLLSVAFKPPELRLTLKLINGTSTDYRVLSNMMQSSFLISPLVRDTKQFVLLAAGDQRYLKNDTVKSIVLTTAYGGSFFWSRDYRLVLRAYHGETASTLPKNFFDSISDSYPEGYVETEASSCDGSIDAVNGFRPDPQVINVSGLLSVEGWLAVSGKDGVAPDRIFVTLKDTSGVSKYLETQRTPRSDVKMHFKRPTMPDVGYTTTVDVTRLNGEYMLGLARGYRGKLAQCQHFNVSVKISGEKD